MKTVTIKWMGEDITLIPQVDIYNDNTTRITFMEENEGPFNTLTICLNLKEHGNEAPELIFVKNYSENIPVVKELLRLGWMKEVNKLHIGPYEAEVLICELQDEEVINQVIHKQHEKNN